MICANSSPRMNCSVKFFDPTTMRFAFRSQAMTGKRSRKTSDRKIDLWCRVKFETSTTKDTKYHEGNLDGQNLRAPSCPWWFTLFLSNDFKLRLRTQRPQSPLQSSEQKVGEERQQRRRNGSRQNDLVVYHG